ncbi:hypothetical protein [uncultured Spirosoma sp.]|uniref:hypothetical protein n=1 Tax=uncultured Spirosoma sp. TaxID=278208 RepID=UPI00258D8C2F|nr:hypothetical protein [uncultured Spirosoma sp.]
MTDQQIIEMWGVDETSQMLAARDSVRAKLTPEVYDPCLDSYKTGLKLIRKTLRLPNYMVTADLLLEQLNADTDLGDEQRNVQKFFVAFAAFDLEEYP